MERTLQTTIDCWRIQPFISACGRFTQSSESAEPQGLSRWKQSVAWFGHARSGGVSEITKEIPKKNDTITNV